MSLIAIVGCSYSAYGQAGGYKHSWSYKLSELYPQHKFLNYACGGRGPDYYRYALLDAKIRGADCVFLSATYDGRIGYLVDSDNSKNNFEFITGKISDNYDIACLHIENEIWISSGRAQSRWKNHNLAKQLERHSADNINIQYNRIWYKHAPVLYNFDKMFVLQFNMWKDGDLPWDDTVWDMLVKLTNVKDKSYLHEKGVCVSEHDDHWTPYGHQLVLDNYILNDDVKNYLTTTTN